MSEHKEECVDCGKDLSDMHFAKIVKCDICENPLCDDCGSEVLEDYNYVIYCKACSEAVKD